MQIYSSHYENSLGELFFKKNADQLTIQDNFKDSSIQDLSKNNNWGIIISTSSGYHNYRNQADACQAYSIFKDKMGFDQDKLIVIASDDIANNKANPLKNQILNKCGQDVYHDCQIDLKGVKNVNKSNILQILSGNKIENQKSLSSNLNSNVFVYILGTGGKSLLQMPNGDHIYADELINSLNQLKKQTNFKQMILVIDSPNAASFFEPFEEELKKMDILAISSTQSLQWATSCYPQDFFQGENMNVCMENQFSSNFFDQIQNSQNYTISEILVQTQENTMKQTVAKWGSVQISEENFQKFFGYKNQEPINLEQNQQSCNLTNQGKQIIVESRNSKMNNLYSLVQEEQSSKNHLNLQLELTSRMKVDNIFEEAFPSFYLLNYDKTYKVDMNLKSKEEFKCYKKLVKTYQESCTLGDGGLQQDEELEDILRIDSSNDYSMKWYAAFSYHCIQALQNDLEKQENIINSVLRKIQLACQH